MSLPRPEPGLVIRYAYLRHRERAAGADDARKDRPCVVVVALADGRVGVIPVTHSAPADGTTAVALAPATCRQLGLDDRPSRAVVDDINHFRWPGPDLRPASGATWTFGRLTPGELAPIVRALRTAIVERRMKQSIRTE